ncbi:MAG: TatD family hydrolase [Metamycoplasmataceae bacterium]
MKRYIDLHAHPIKEYFEFPEIIIEKSYEKGITRLFIVGTTIKESKEVKELCLKYNFAFPIIGIHPNSATDRKDIEDLKELVDDSIVGIGEIGFDFHYNDSPSKEEQEFFFRNQIEIALEKNIPIIIHSRDATEETFELLKEYKENNPALKIILHSYSSGPEWVERFLSIGAYLSYSGIVTFKNAKSMQEALKMTPLDRLFYETDTPYLTPTPKRGKINKPYYAIYIANFIAELKGITVEKLNHHVNKNVEDVFNLKKEHNG